MTRPLALAALAATLLVATLPAQAQGQGQGQGQSQTPARPGATSGTPENVDIGALSRGLSMHRLLDADVHGEGDREIGEIEDVVLPEGGGAPVAVLSVGGFLGVGERHVAVPLAQLQHDAQRGRWSLPGATAESLKAMPSVSLADMRRGGSDRGGATPRAATGSPGALSGGPSGGSGQQLNR
ncbi:PRC-barrel domain-containing protein [Roseomonas sp. USHLN139]|uniref:PRC-barrel domain-containing protein n=1 Tax=Roseomonas sp. USHLN139 TaxID=3081298 RepID=UPI003B01AD40